jgi:hypothetical protein
MAPPFSLYDLYARPVFMRFLHAPRQFPLEFIRAERLLMAHRGSAAAVLLAVDPQFLSSLDLHQLRAAPAVTRFTGWQRRREMLDTIMMAAGVAFFALAIAYVAACDRM